MTSPAVGLPVLRMLITVSVDQESCGLLQVRPFAGKQVNLKERTRYPSSYLLIWVHKQSLNIFHEQVEM